MLHLTFKKSSISKKLIGKSSQFPETSQNDSWKKEAQDTEN